MCMQTKAIVGIKFLQETFVFTFIKINSSVKGTSQILIIFVMILITILKI